MQRMPANLQYSPLKRMNKKGDIPITILVIGVIAVCILTIFSFMLLKSDIDKTFVGAGLIETIYSLQEEQQLNIPGFQKPVSKGVYSVKITFDENSGKFYGEFNLITGGFSKKPKTLVSIEYNPIK